MSVDNGILILLAFHLTVGEIQVRHFTEQIQDVVYD